MVNRNDKLAQFQASYLFLEITKRKEALLASCPEAKLISLGIGDTTEPIPAIISEAMERFASALATKRGYRGYGEPFGDPALREKIAENYPGIEPDEIFVSDGSKCDIGRLQLLFDEMTPVAVQDPSYPVYEIASLLYGKKEITFLPCLEENDFVPDFSLVKEGSLIYICNPNNPTGVALTKEQLSSVVKIAKERSSLIIYDSAYASYIRDNCPRSIYEIEGAKEVAIETASLSKMAGFTGIRLGWTVVPKEICFKDGSPLIKDWERIVSSLFNGASNIAQAGAAATLSAAGQKACRALQDRYLQNATLLKAALKSCGLTSVGGEHAPYLFVSFKGRSSWELFDELLEKAHLITTPGVGFGVSGESYLRLSAFGKKEEIEEAASHLKSHFLPLEFQRLKRSSILIEN